MQFSGENVVNKNFFKYIYAYMHVIIEKVIKYKENKNGHDMWILHQGHAILNIIIKTSVDF